LSRDRARLAEPRVTVDVGLLRTAAMGLFTLGWIPVFVLRSERFHERRRHAEPDERRAMWNAALAVTVHVTLAEVALKTAAADAPPAPRLVVGMLVFVVGLAFWMLARHTLVASGRLLDPSVPPPALVAHGPFAVVRHPLALGMVILALGPALTAATPLTWVSFATVVVAMARRCVLDEIELRATFGAAYDAYAAATPRRMIPFAW
jgi:protein-S-isoprenylcysteine O-methyltransferase Ste14